MCLNCTAIDDRIDLFDETGDKQYINEALKLLNETENHSLDCMARSL